MSSFQIIIGSMLGGTEYVAEAVEEALKAYDHQTNLHFQPEYSQIEQKDQTWIFCTSTHGAGDFPENIQKFIHDLKACDQSLNDLKFAVIAVGDSSYDTFCKAGKEIKNIMLEKSAKEIIELFTIDMIKVDDPEEEANLWIRSKIDHL